MRIGASQYHPGLTVRWVHHGCGFLSIRAHNSVGAVIAGNAPSGYAVLGRFPGKSTVDEPYTRRCDAKRAAEVLVGQWWREKCEREAKARAMGLTAVRTFTLPAAFFDATAAVLPNLDYAKLVQEAASE